MVEEPRIHKLKTLPEYFHAVWAEEKLFEVRYNDRDFQKGDLLQLQEYIPEFYTGREVLAEVTYILNDEVYCKEGYVIMSLLIIEKRGEK